MPLLENYDRIIGALRAENEILKNEKSAADLLLTVQYNKLVKARAEAFQLKEELKLLQDEVAHGWLQVNPVKTVSSSMCQKKATGKWTNPHGQKRKRIADLVKTL